MTSPFVSLEKAAVNMHEGAGPESLLQAAQAWGVMAQKLQTAADAVLSVITSCDEQYWQSPAAQQMHNALTSVAQVLKNNAVVARQLETAATRVPAAFDKARTATATPQHVADNRQTRAQLVAADRLRLHQPQIAELDVAYEVMWLHSITAHDNYYHDTSHALQQGEQTWWPPHQQPAEAPTTTGGHPPTPDAPDIPAQITQHRDTAAWCRIYALDHAIRARQDQEGYEQHSGYARTCKSFADHEKATAELCNKVAQHYREAAQLYKDFPLGQADIPALAQKYVDIATTWKQTKQQMLKTIAAYHAASATRPHLQETGNNLSELEKIIKQSVEVLFTYQSLDFDNLDLHSYTDSLQEFFEQGFPHHQAEFQESASKAKADIYASAAARIQDCALNRAEEAGNAWRAADQHTQSITGHVRDFVVSLQMAARQDHHATTLAGSPA